MEMAPVPHKITAAVFGDLPDSVDTRYMSDCLQLVNHRIGRMNSTIIGRMYPVTGDVQCPIAAVRADVDGSTAAVLMVWRLPVMDEIKNAAPLKARIV